MARGHPPAPNWKTRIRKLFWSSTSTSSDNDSSRSEQTFYEPIDDHTRHPSCSSNSPDPKFGLRIRSRTRSIARSRSSVRNDHDTHQNINNFDDAIEVRNSIRGKKFSEIESSSERNVSPRLGLS